ncbi:MAG: 4-hydroxy-tetrahydrodipicolinate reductase [Candidatus Anaerobiospirillum merdipullorum]|uniref:4-hydroxy-tetrahydrodipicolinate reductase n=1 Tax=Candidatus Anaerobiospirillum merdipullorum TaxID=2838450 RepID=A0A9E2KQG3_9GAMM|nr:4-hydroxy-tetrahydrodipicolinate reductase [Candidatus Anaerobiospirillum merdipullorum]
MLKLGIVGISGRMGHALYDSIVGMDGLKLCCGIDSNVQSLPIGCTVEVAPSVQELKTLPQMFIDFTRPQCSLEVLRFAADHGIAYVLGTTGFDEAGKAEIAACAKKIPLVMASNFSVGVNLLLALVKETSAIMQDADIEIVEAHHRYKVDAPSGTALSLGEAAAAGRGVELKDVMVAGRNGITGERQYGTIGFSSVRGGDIVGDHSVMFCADGELVELKHHASSRATFARGALRAARWLEGRAPGLYGMPQVLGLNG